MRAILTFPSLMLLSGCFGNWQVSEAALCDGTRADRKAHAAALLVDGGPQSKMTGAVLLSKLRAGCAE